MNYLPVYQDILDDRWNLFLAPDTSPDILRVLGNPVARVRQCVALSADNVAEYVRRIGFVSLEDLPAVVPPWPDTFCEYEVTPGTRIGFLITMRRCDNDPDADPATDVRRSHQRFLDSIQGSPRELEATVGPLFIIHAVTFWRQHGRTLGPTSIVQWLTREDGRLVGVRGRVADDGVFYWQVNKEPAERFGEVLKPLFATFAFAHCRNVAKIEEAPAYTSRQEKRAAERRGDGPLVKFYTLRIDPSAIRTQRSNRQPTPIHKRDLPLHIVRGHFAHYSEDKPLFGKYAGQFWIPAHVRGSEKAGIVGKDYAVKAPREDAA